MALHLILFFILVLATFAIGHRLIDAFDVDRKLTRFERLSLSFPCAFGLFSLVNGPLLLANAPYKVALMVSSVGGIAILLSQFVWKRKESVPPPTPVRLGKRRPVNNAWLCLLISCAIAAALFVHFESLQKPLAGLCFLLFCGGIEFCRRAWFANDPADTNSTGLLSSVNKAELVLAAAWVLFAIVIAVVCVREDADDVLYLSEALALQDSPAMGQFTPVHRGEQLPSTLAYAWQAFELWGAMLADLSGLHTLIVFRTAFAPVLVVASLMLYASLFLRILPQSLLPLAISGAIAYFVLAPSSMFAGNAYLLTRSSQGKSWLMHIGFPALALATQYFLSSVNRRSLAVLCLVSFACLGFAPTSVFTCIPILFVLLLIERSTQSEVWRVRPLAGMAIAAAPFVLFGVYLMLFQNDTTKSLAFGYEDDTTWRGALLFFHLNIGKSGGATEIFLLMAMPLFLATTTTWQSRRYPLAFTVMFGALVLNPLAFPLLESIIGYTSYSRMLWAIPFPLFAGLLFAIVGERFTTPGRCITILLLPLVFLMLGGRPIFIEQALSNSKGPPPYVIENAFQMPDELLQLANAIEGPEAGPDRRILCSVRSASHLAPYRADFNFVYARSYQTEVALVKAGRADEAERRRQLGQDFLAGELSHEKAVALLTSEKAHHVILESELPNVREALQVTGFTLKKQTKTWQLWSKDLVAN